MGVLRAMLHLFNMSGFSAGLNLDRVTQELMHRTFLSYFYHAGLLFGGDIACDVDKAFHMRDLSCICFFDADTDFQVNPLDIPAFFISIHS